MEGTTPDVSVNECLFPSFAHSTGFALGQMLLLMDRPQDLAGCLQAIQVAAQATLLSGDLGLGELGKDHVRGVKLASAALSVVRTWHEETRDLTALGEAVQVLQDVLDAMGVRYVPPSDAGS
jgi:hypothetical protein